VPNVNGLVTVNGFFGSGRLGKEYRATFRNFRIMSLIAPKYKAIWRYYKREFQPADIKVPVLVITSKTDIVVPYVQSLNFYEQLNQPKMLVTLKNADHNISSKANQAEVIKTIDAWIKKTIL
jgi:alpha-beta hydrolase superfamily lysophospholipase